MSKRAQIALIWWAIAFIVIYGLALGLLLHMIPPPRATLDASQIAHWYRHRDTSIKVGAVIASYTSAFMLPISVVVSIQISRLERGRPVWAVTACASGCLMSIFLVLPPLFFGVAAFTPARDPQITATMHELGLLTLVTTDQYYVFMWVAVGVICFVKTSVAHSPFPRWFGYLTLWIALMFEAGAIAFLTRTGPFAWNGLLVFWSPLTLFGVWLGTMSVLLLRALRQQAADETTLPLIDEVAPPAPVGV